MACARCGQRDYRSVTRAKLAERDGRVAVVLDVPMQECSACGDRWLAWPVARVLDARLSALLNTGADLATARFAGG